VCTGRAQGVVAGCDGTGPVTDQLPREVSSRT
jgi:hypothetical protein